MHEKSCNREKSLAFGLKITSFFGSTSNLDNFQHRLGTSFWRVMISPSGLGQGILKIQGIPVQRAHCIELVQSHYQSEQQVCDAPAVVI